MSGTIRWKTRGHKRAKLRLEGLLATGRIPSALLFHGLEGVGKTRLAREFAQALLCPAVCGLCAHCQAVEKNAHPDVKLVNAQYQAALREEEAAKQRTLRVETVRHLRKDMELQSLLGGWKVAIVEDAQSMEVEAANALLKILEEPPEKTLWILIASQKDRLLKTVVSRCFSIPFSPLPAADVASILSERGADKSFADLAEGSVSRAIELAELGEPSEESLPKELYAQRTQVELALFSYAQKARRRLLSGEAEFADVEPLMIEIAKLRKALRSNVDPRTILSLAGLRSR